MYVSSPRKTNPAITINNILRINLSSNKIICVVSTVLCDGKSNRIMDTTTMQKSRIVAIILPIPVPRAIRNMEIIATAHRIPKTQIPAPNPTIKAIKFVNLFYFKMNKLMKSVL